MDYFARFREDVLALVNDKIAGEVPHFAVELPRDKNHGDLATNVAMVLSKQMGQNPRAFAESLVPQLISLPYVDTAEIAGPGFINIRIKKEAWAQWLHQLIQAPQKTLFTHPLKGEKVNVEYVSANPTGPMHAGHGRVAVVGDVIANMYEAAGAEVLREYYINDGGAQAQTLADSAYLRYQEACGRDVGEIPEGLYPGDYLIPVGEELKSLHGETLLDQSENIWRPIVQPFVIDAMMDMIREDLTEVGINHHVFTSENKLVEAGELLKVVELLRDKGYVYEGTLERPKGIETDEDWAPEKQLLFKSTAFGDDVDRVLQKHNGEWTYFAKDIAYHYNKWQRGYTRQVNIWGADHKGYVQRLKGAISAISADIKLDVLLCNLVKFMQNGEPLTMSKRSGSFITLHDVIEGVGRDILRFVMITRKNDSPLDFDFEKVKEQSKDNPVFYVQYAHARVYSVFRNAALQHAGHDFSAQSLTIDPNHLDEADITLIKKMAEWPRMFEGALHTQDPQRISQYLYDLAATFHNLWNMGKENAKLRFIAPDVATTRSRLSLLRGVATVIASGLNIFGVSPVEEM